MYYLITPCLGLVNTAGFIDYSNDPKTKEFPSLLSAVKFAQRFNDAHIWVCSHNPFKQICSINKETKIITRF